MKALSLTQPWPWIILNLGKRIENRGRNIGTHRGPLLLHATSRMTSDDWWLAYDFVRARLDAETAARIPGPFPPAFLRADFDHRGMVCRRITHPALPLGAIVARCNVVGQLKPDGCVDPNADWAEQKAHWYMGKHAYLLDAVEPTSVVPCKGALGFWNVPQAVLQQMEGT